MQNKKIIMYTDGGARGNPGPAGAGAYITDEKGKVLKEISQFLGHRTNNWAEYEAVILGLEALKKMFGAVALKQIRVEVRMDSELVARQLNHKYQVKEPSLFPQFIKVNNLEVSVVPNVVFTHVPRELNKEADRLANVAMDRENN
jgi:ribonuclease HI